VHKISNQIERVPLLFPYNDFSHLFNVVRLGLNNCFDYGFADFGAADSVIVTLSDQYIHSLHDLLVNSDSEFLFAIATTT